LASSHSRSSQWNLKKLSGPERRNIDLSSGYCLAHFNDVLSEIHVFLATPKLLVGTFNSGLAKRELRGIKARGSTLDFVL
jgi:hypothetical protein